MLQSAKAEGNWALVAREKRTASQQREQNIVCAGNFSLPGPDPLTRLKKTPSVF